MGNGHRTILGPTLRQRRFGAEVIYSKDLNKSSIECRMRMLQKSLKNYWKMVEHELKMRERCIITSERRPLRLLRFHQRWVWENGSLNGMQSQRACIFELVSYIIFMFHDGPLTWQILTAFLIMSGHCLHFVIRCLLSFPLKSWAPRSHAWPSFPGRVCTLRTVRAYHECFLQLLPRSSCQSATRRKGIELWCKTVIGTWIRRIALWAGTWHMAMSVTGCYSKSWQIPRIGKIEDDTSWTNSCFF